MPTLPERGYQQLKAVELALCHAADSVIAVSQNDRDRLVKDGIEPAKIRVIPHGVDHHAFQQARELNIRELYNIAQDAILLVYHGTYSYPPNHQAMRVMAEVILPVLEAQGHKVAVLAIGSSPPADIQHPAIIFTGSVADIASLLKSADMAVVTLQEGGGTRMKIMDYFAAGIPVISTTKGIEGIPVLPGVHALVLDTPEAICQAITRLASDPSEAARLVGNAADFVESLSWDALTRQYLPLLDMPRSRA